MNRIVIILSLVFLGIVNIYAQDVMVSVAPIQQVLPPQALMYVDNPGKYFNITVTNTSATNQQVYLTMQIERISPSPSNVLVTPYSRQPAQPLIVPAGRTIQMNMVEMKHLFSYLSPGEISYTSDLFTGYGNGSYGLLPEGRYSVSFVAYKWRLPQLASPVVVSNPASGRAFFHVSYKASAPEFLTPVYPVNNKGGYAEVDPLNAMFTWKESVLKSFGNFIQYSYTFRVVEVLKNQPVDYAMDNNPVVYQVRNLIAPMCIIPVSYVKNRFAEGKMYAARVTATPRTKGALAFSLVENSGKSDIKIFQIVPIEKKTVEPADTLADEEIFASVRNVPDEDDNDYSVEEYASMIEEDMRLASHYEQLIKDVDSLALRKYKEMHLSLYLMHRLPFPAAKKAGYTQRTKESYAVIQHCVTRGNEYYELVSEQYLHAYRSLKKLEKQRHRLHDDSECAEAKQMYNECIELVSQTRQIAKSAKERNDCLNMTNSRSKWEIRYINRFK